MLNPDPTIRKAISEYIPCGYNSSNFTGRYEKGFYPTLFFHMTPTVAALTMLSKFQNNVKNAESQVVTIAA